MMKWKYLGLMSALLIIYNIIGGIIFHLLEYNNEHHTKTVTLQYVQDLLGEYFTNYSPIVTLSLPKFLLS